MDDSRFMKCVPYVCCMIGVSIIFIVFVVIVLLNPPRAFPPEASVKAAAIPLLSAKPEGSVSWQAPDSTRIPATPEGDLIRYGRELVAHTARYLGPSGKVMQISNGMNCQNCHLNAGKKVFGNNYAGVAPTYPKFRARSGTIETIEKRVNDCIERSLNGKRLDENGKEMKAFISYIKWVGSEVESGVYPNGAGLVDLPVLDRPADPIKGAIVYQQICSKCHGAKGEGLREPGSLEWKYPPLCNDNSYNVSAGLYRLSRFAGYVKANMPNGVTYANPELTDEQAWDVAAYVNSLPRPVKRFAQDWPDISKKPFDHPYGPYADNFSEAEHKYGPFAPIKALQKK